MAFVMQTDKSWLWYFGSYECIKPGMKKEENDRLNMNIMDRAFVSMLFDSLHMWLSIVNEPFSYVEDLFADFPALHPFNDDCLALFV